MHNIILFNGIYIAGLMLIMASCGKEDEIKNESDINKTEKDIPCIPSGLGNDVIAFYPFSDGSLDDIAGNQHDLTNPTTASPTADRNGNANCAYKFTNLPTSSEFLTTTNTAFLNNLNEFSISLWYQPKDTSRMIGAFESLINRDVGQACPDRKGQWSVGLYDCRRAVFGRTNSVWDKTITSGDCKSEAIARTGYWSHLVATYKKSGIEMKIYRNGVLQSTSYGNAECSPGVSSSSMDIGDLFLGKDYTGAIDDVILFNKTLSQLEVDALFTMKTCCEE